MIAAVRAASIRTLYAQMHTTAFAALVVTAYIVVTAWPFTPSPLIMSWALAALVVQLMREGLIRWFRARDRPDEGLERWATRFLLHQALTGLVWGATIVLFAHPSQPVTVALTLCCLYSIAAGGVASQAYNPRSLYVLVGVIFSMVLARLSMTGELGYVMLGVASMLFAVTMMGYCRVQARAVEDGLAIRFENADLVQRLTVQRAVADEARRKAEMASLAKSQFLAAASHDLRQPLYALSLFSASLNELRLDDEGRGVVGNIQDSIGAMESLFEGLLDVSKFEAGVVVAQLAPVSVDALFDRLGQYFTPIAAERGLELRLRSNGEWVCSDAALLEQVLSNLVSNALRCTTRGGVLVATRRRGANLRLEVWDTGKGIEEGDRERVFEEFVQLDNPERDRRKGLGLGLAIARRAASLIDGEITLTSTLGRGSCFGLAQRLVHGAALAADAGATRQVVAPIEWRRDLPILVVEDDRDVRQALAGLLGRWRLSVDVVDGAEAALARVSEGRRYGLVLTDYRLSGAMDGLALLAAIASRHPEPAPATAVITGDLDSGLLLRAHESGRSNASQTPSSHRSWRAPGRLDHPGRAAADPA